MAQAKRDKHPLHTIEIESEPEKRMAEELKRALATKSSRHGNESQRERPVKGK